MLGSGKRRLTKASIIVRWQGGERVTGSNLPKWYDGVGVTAFSPPGVTYLGLYGNVWRDLVEWGGCCRLQWHLTQRAVGWPNPVPGCQWVVVHVQRFHWYDAARSRSETHVPLCGGGGGEGGGVTRARAGGKGGEGNL